MYKIERNGYYVGEVDKDGYGHVDGVTGRFTTSGEPISGEKYVDSDGHNCVVDVWGDIVEDPYERGQRIEQELRDIIRRHSESWDIPSDDPIEKLLTLPFKGLFKLGRLIVTSPFKGVKRKIAQIQR